jgi:WD40 repeat protein
MFDPIDIHLELHEILHNCCFHLKPGISSISVLEETSLMGERRSYLVTGAFDYRIRFYDLDKHQPLGHLKYNTSRINQINLTKSDDNVFLLVASDEACFHIWLIS